MRKTAMNLEEYQALPITWADAPLAYPLVYLHDASVSLDAWLDFVRQRVDSGDDDTGLIVIRDRKGIVHALFAHRVDRDLKGARQLGIAQLIVAQIPGSQIDQAVMAATSQIADQLNCRSITIEQPFQLMSHAFTQAPSAA
jgi:hypothetical protein